MKTIFGEQSDGGAGEKKARKTEAKVVGYDQEILVEERTVRGGSVRPD